MKRERGPRILLSIANGWMVRNYVRSGVLNRLIAEGGDVHVLLPPGDRALAQELRAGGAAVHDLSQPPVGRLPSFLTAVLAYAHNRALGLWDGIFWEWVVSTEPPAKRALLRCVQLASWAVDRAGLLEPGRRLQRRLLEALPDIDRYQGLLGEIRPAVVLTTNPFGFPEAPLLVAAERAKVPSVGVIASWDNLGYKGYPLVTADAYLVWSELMKEELLRADPSIARDRVTAVGSPQFDFHLRRDLEWSREVLYDRIGADLGRGLVCYSATTDIAFPDEPEIVRGLHAAMESGEVVDRPQLVVRIHPLDPSDRFERLADECDNLIVMRPWRRDERLLWFNPSLDDLALFSNTLRYSSASVNAFSTVLLDSAVLDVPVVAIAFSHNPDTPSGRYTRHAPFFGHCRYITRYDGVRIAESQEELVDHLNEYMRDPGHHRDARRAMVEGVCGPADGEAADRIAEGILSLARIGSLTRLPSRHTT